MATSVRPWVLGFPLGEVLLVLVGIGIAIYGFTQLKMAWDGRADEDIDAVRGRREAAWILPLGRIGTAARSVILIGMGLTLLWSGLQERPSNADGYSEVLSAIASVPGEYEKGHEGRLASVPFDVGPPSSWRTSAGRLVIRPR